MGAAEREGGAGLGASGSACPIPWCGRAPLKYATYSPRMRRRRRSPRTSTWSRHSRRTLPRKRSQAAFARGARTGVRSMLSYRLFTAQDTLGALNLYSREPDAFDDDAVSIGTVLAAHAALAVARARDREQVSGLRHALTSNRTIGMAMGILMATRRVREQEAFDLLRVASQRTNRKLRAIAGDVVRCGEL